MTVLLSFAGRFLRQEINHRLAPLAVSNVCRLAIPSKLPLQKFCFSDDSITVIDCGVLG